MKQVVDLQGSTQFQDLGVEFLSISPDSVQAWADAGRTMGITTPMLSDDGNRVADSYGVMAWAMGNEPGHTFVLVGRDGRIIWMRDYGAPNHGGLMYVSPDELVPQIAQQLGSS